MLDKASLKLLLRARAALSAPMVLIGERIRPEQVSTLLRNAAMTDRICVRDGTS
jgi:hypothetical protein